MTNNLCASCCYPFIATNDDIWKLFYQKCGRYIILDEVDHPLLNLLPLKSFLGFRSFDYDKRLCNIIYNTRSDLGTVKVGHSTMSANFLWQEIYYASIRNHPESKWVEKLTEILNEYKSHPSS